MTQFPECSSIFWEARPFQGNIFEKPGNILRKPGHIYGKLGHIYGKQCDRFGKPGDNLGKPGHIFGKPGHFQVEIPHSTHMVSLIIFPRVNIHREKLKNII